ncbi:MAG: hypothetical protein JHC57_15355 [Sphingopyxis sp.]|uniref:hypothetical protein n=1 Tax=Sphingopyxis sp. TaxID=1908224 RepID=UPI001A34A592|nr:hypothetical protein [Sphingopyxis sp.]MBJ7501130.1 hypothetical protein [Sphingopyxis sp.]
MLMAPEIDCVIVGGSWLHGRGGFIFCHRRLFDSRFRGSTIMPLEKAAGEA